MTRTCFLCLKMPGFLYFPKHSLDFKNAGYNVSKTNCNTTIISNQFQNRVPWASGADPGFLEGGGSGSSQRAFSKGTSWVTDVGRGQFYSRSEGLWWPRGGFEPPEPPLWIRAWAYKGFNMWGEVQFSTILMKTLIYVWYSDNLRNLSWK